MKRLDEKQAVRVLFLGREHRMRRRETMLHAPKGIVFQSRQPLAAMKREYELSNTNNRSAFEKIRSAFQQEHYLSKKSLQQIDLIYSPGKIVLNKFPHVIEIDNVAVLAYYNLKLLKLGKSWIQKQLESPYCKSIICISHAAKAGVLHFFHSATIRKKTQVVYPYMEEHFNLRTKNKKHTEFLFISTNFYLKGGKELVNVFENLKQKAKLTIITKVKDIEHSLLRKIQSNKNITLVEANKSKKELYQKYYARADVFILPTFQDSFGLVILEALSFGLPIISTNSYAIPEMVHHGKNGYLINPPFQYFDQRTQLPNSKIWKKNLAAYTRQTSFPSVEKELKHHLKKLLEHPEIIKNMQKESEKLFKRKFNEQKRLQFMKAALVK